MTSVIYKPDVYAFFRWPIFFMIRTISYPSGKSSYKEEEHEQRKDRPITQDCSAVRKSGCKSQCTSIGEHDSPIHFILVPGLPGIGCIHLVNNRFISSSCRIRNTYVHHFPRLHARIVF